MARLPNRELVAAFAAMVVITVVYGGVTRAFGVPRAVGLVGHSLGIVGLGLMLFTEVGYSLRKRAVGRPRGTMRAWLQVHIFTGIVGPYLVLLHTAWSFNGLAGALTVLVLIVVISGFLGRYIYTAVPRTADGAILEAEEVGRLLEAARTEAAAAHAEGVGRDVAAVRRERDAARRLRTLERQLAALRWARRALATWHTIHIPIGMAMFVTAGAHIMAALYYATLSR
jgi:hypothetical protein